MPKKKHNHNTSYRDLCISALKDSGARITKQRLAVIDCIERAKKPLSAPEVYERLSSSSNKDTKIDKVSVYRVLETLLSLSLIHQVPPSGDYIACSHLECKNVYHVISRCTECSAVEEVDVPADTVAPLLAHMEKSFRFLPNAHLLQMEGRCKDCAD